MTEQMKCEEAKELPLVDEDDYTATIKRIETDKQGKFGLMVILHFDINGVEVAALASQNLNANTKLHRWIGILTGKSPEVGDTIKFKDLEGKKALVTVRNRAVLDDNGKEQLRDGKTVKTSNVTELRKAE